MVPSGRAIAAETASGAKPFLDRLRQLHSLAAQEKRGTENDIKCEEVIGGGLLVRAAVRVKLAQDLRVKDPFAPFGPSICEGEARQKTTDIQKAGSMRNQMIAT